MTKGLLVFEWVKKEGWARKFLDNLKASLKWQSMHSFEKFAAMIERHWNGIVAYYRPENGVPLELQMSHHQATEGNMGDRCRGIHCFCKESNIVRSN